MIFPRADFNGETFQCDTGRPLQSTRQAARTHT